MALYIFSMKNAPDDVELTLLGSNGRWLNHGLVEADNRVHATANLNLLFDHWKAERKMSHPRADRYEFTELNEATLKNKDPRFGLILGYFGDR